jgi:squalene synthase HpnC
MTSAIIQQLDTYGPQRCAKLDYPQADAYTRELAESHYENFTVVSVLLPRALRAHFRHVYAFCRWADDLGDEAGDPARALDLLSWWRRELDACYAGQPRHPVFVALTPTIRRFDIPRKPFDDLIDAFVQDQRVRRYDSFAQAVDYCTRSANPVGRLVLYVCGCRDEERQRLSDATCTALQLANFWQDVRRDILERDRVYVPAEIAAGHGLDVAAMVTSVQFDAQDQGRTARFSADSEPRLNGRVDNTPPPPHHQITKHHITHLLPAYRATLKDLVDRTWPMFAQGRQLWPLLDRRVRLDIELFTLGGESILRLIERQDYDTLTRRPSLSTPAKLRLLFHAVLGRLTCGCGGTTPDPKRGNGS